MMALDMARGEVDERIGRPDLSVLLLMTMRGDELMLHRLHGNLMGDVDFRATTLRDGRLSLDFWLKDERPGGQHFGWVQEPLDVVGYALGYALAWKVNAWAAGEADRIERERQASAKAAWARVVVPANCRCWVAPLCPFCGGPRGRSCRCRRRPCHRMLGPHEAEA